ncbi:UNKNOWN [Stylonychia lemnae]|uniref:Uncharacterized protein n=1 Tax=Stylonychia lemnae TaxID=5949 RepID=A0A078ADK1_STYLE|nr:UNKNOWN [Stylonychia lemnae]|eukprot:CDW79901.1 UNKNOWN [Stylonychia lemnae]
MDEIKEIAPKQYKALPQKAAQPQQQQQQPREEVKEEQKNPKAKGNQGPQQRSKFAQLMRMGEQDLTEEEVQEVKKFEASRLQSITNEVVEYFPRVMLFHTLVVTFCAIRSPTDTAVIFTYFTVLLRCLMVSGWYHKRQFVYLSAGAGEALINVILFFITLTYSPY